MALLSRALGASVFALALTLTSACVHSGIIGSDGDIERLVQAGQGEVVFWHTYSEEETRVFETEVLPRFRELHPHINVVAERVYHTNELKSTLIGRATSRKPPDVVRLDIVWIPQFAHLGVLHPLGVFPDFAVVKETLHPVALETSRAGGEYYGLPLNMNTKAAIYNRDLLREAGYDTPPSSLYEVVEIAVERGWVIGMDSVDAWGSLPYFQALGGEFLSSDYTRASGYLDSDASVAALETLVDLYQQGVLNPHLFRSGNDRWNDVVEGHVFMIDEGPWFYSILQNFGDEGTDVERATVATPFPGGGRPASILGGENLVMMKSVRNPEEAWTFMKWMIGQEAQETMFKTGMIPTHIETAQRTEGIGNTYIEAYVEAMDEAFLRPPLAQFEDVEKVYVRMMNDIFVHGADVREAAREAAKAIDDLLPAKR